MYGFLASPRWLSIHAATGALVAVFVLLGLWQLGQFQRPATSFTREVGAAAPLGRVSAAGAPAAPGSLGRLVTVTGTYDVGRQVLVGDRRLEGRAGYLVLTPLRTADGSGVIVDRGWVPATGVAATRVPAGEVTVIGRLTGSETDAETGVPPLVDPPAGQAYRINTDELGAGLPYPLHTGYLELLDQRPPAADAPAVAAAGQSGGGRWYNAGYTAQWFLFALAAIGFWARLVRTEVGERRGRTTRSLLHRDVDRERA